MMIRPYEPKDRHAVRQLCGDTADRGEPVERFFHDRELVVDLVTSYYTDVESALSWVAEADGQVIGYLTGYLDRPRYHRVMAGRIVPRALLRALGRGALWAADSWAMIAAALHTWRRGGWCRRVPLERYPAAFHINIRHGFRGRQVGRALVERFLEAVRQARLGGVHVAVSVENDTACRFFERLGFQALARYPMVRINGGRQHLTSTVIYGIAL